MIPREILDGRFGLVWSQKRD
uniref:Uncharacterized protein n=1 Tax=Arundo donax TaxID=35708 RepID=A0A0A8YVF8_ARUDO